MMIVAVLLEETLVTVMFVCVDWQKGERKIEDDAANIVF